MTVGPLLPPYESWLFVRAYQRGSVFVDPSNLVVKLAALFLPSVACTS